MSAARVVRAAVALTVGAWAVIALAYMQVSIRAHGPANEGERG